MSPTNKKKLDKLRIKLDRLDNDLLKLIKKRSILVNEVLKVKIHKKEIIDQKRINFILKKIKKKSIQNKIWERFKLARPISTQNRSRQIGINEVF